MMTTEEKIWNYLTAAGLNACGAAGLMGNLYAESGLSPINLQNTYEKKLGYTDATYTAAVDSGTYTNFDKDGAGYGLAQWTYWSRKEALLAFAKAQGKSIGDLEMQLGFLMQELSSYGLMTSLKTAASVQAASDLVLLKFEKPADQSEAAKTRRAGYGQAYYDKYAGAAKAPAGGGSTMSVLIGHASIDENGRASGGQAGDQTGKEVCIQTWYSSGWNVILRPKSTDVAEKMASACEILCKSNLVGYDQGQRNTLWDELEKVGWNPSALKTKCETDCSAFMTACARVAGINVPRVALGNGQYNAPITQTMRSAFGGTGMFEVLTDSKYCTSDRYLKRGDVLVRESGHTAMALGNGDLAGGSTAQAAAATSAAAAATERKATEPAYSFDKTLEGTYVVTAASGLHLRNGAGTGKASLAVLPMGTKVQNYGYYTLFGGVKWLYVQVTYNGVKYTGFSSSQYLRK